MKRHPLKYSEVADQINALVDWPLQHALTQEQFDLIRLLASKNAGIYIADHKKSMVQRRVIRRLAALKLNSFKEYCDFIVTPAGQQEHEYLINALTTNKTEFFRESHHFEHLRRSILPPLMAAARSQRKRIRIWSAGCSSGQEPYSIAMTLLSVMPDIQQLDAKILATDIDTDILAKAATGVFSEEEVSTIPASAQSNWLRPSLGNKRQYTFAPQVFELVSFRHLNLHGEWPMTGRFDVIFCRNVVIYFDKKTQIRLFGRFADILIPSGTLYVGHSESLFRVSERFRFEGQSIYTRQQ